MRPAELDPVLYSLLEDAMEGNVESPNATCADQERHLASVAPAPLPPALAASLAELLSECDFPEEEKVVQFPAKANTPVASKRRNHWMGTAAAVVAVAGALFGLLVTPDEGADDSQHAPVAQSTTGVSKDTLDPAAFMPAAFDSTVRDTKNLGLMWDRNDSPMRVIKVIYMDTGNYINENGEEVVVKVPRVEYMLLPEDLD